MPRTAVYLIAWLAFLVAAIAFISRFVPVVNHAVLLVSALSPYLMIGAVISAVLLLSTGPWWAAAPTVVLTAAMIYVQLPLFTASGNPAGPAVRVLTSNLHESRADAQALADTARESADVLVVQELTAEFAEQLDQRNLNSDFPFRAIAPADGASGLGIWSRFPILRSSRVPGYELGVIRATVHVPDANADAVIMGVHLVGPWPQSADRWQREIADLSTTLHQIADAAGAGSVIVAGDFNATMDMAPFRRLLHNGYEDSREHSGAGLAPTFPADSTVPPLVGIDHILVRNGLAAATRTVRVPGSDHLGLAATVHLPS